MLIYRNHEPGILNRLLTISCFFLTVGLAFSQPYPSNKGSFQVDQKLGCAPLTINITQLIAATFTAQYNYEGGSTFTLSKTHTFNNPGTYNVLAVYNGLIPGSTDNTDGITIVVTQNIQPEFEISSCSNQQVSIKVTDTNYDQYLVDFDNNNTVDRTIIAGGNQTTTFQYPAAGGQTITVRGRDLNGADNCAKKVQAFTAIPALPAATANTLTVVDAVSIKLDYTPNVNVQYRAVIATDNATTFQQFQTFTSASNAQQSLTLASLTTDDKYYCFRVNAYDPCNNTSVASNTICTANLDLNIANNVNQLVWTTSTTGVTNYTVRRDLTNYQTVNVTNYSDVTPNIVCNTDYCYSIVTNYTNGSKSFSLEKCGTSISTNVPTAIENGSAVINGGSVDLSWVQDPVYTPEMYAVNRNNTLHTLVTTPGYSDASYSSEANYCYMINYIDVCQNSSPDGVIICPIKLSGSLDNANNVTLTWSAYTGWKNGVKQYRIDKYDISGSLMTTFTHTDLSNLSLEDTANDPDNQVVEYVVTAIPNDASLTESVSNRIRITKQARLIFPTAFTPNRDNLNDNFTVIGQYVDAMTLKIFDRWGTLIFSTETNEPWDGTQGGRVMPETTFIWKAFITDKTGKTSTRIGTVALLHN